MFTVYKQMLYFGLLHVNGGGLLDYVDYFLSQKIVHLKTEHHIFFDAGSFSFVQKLLSEIH